MSKFTIPKELARVLLQGWCDSSNQEVELDEVYQAYTETEDDARILTLFSYWSNDLICVFSETPHIRLTIERESGVYKVADVPNPPLHIVGKRLYWSPGTNKWDYKTKTEKWVPGSWQVSAFEEEDSGKD